MWLYCVREALVGIPNQVIRAATTPIAGSNRCARAVSLLDNDSPSYQNRYHRHAMAAKFKAARLEAVQDVTFGDEARHMVALVGRKPAASAEGQLGQAA
jgi:hypothetical protein